jgi:hypothetical protein
MTAHPEGAKSSTRHPALASCSFEYLFRSSYCALPVLAFLTPHDHGALSFVSVTVRRLLVDRAVKVPMGCGALCGVEAYRTSAGRDLAFKKYRRETLRAMIGGHLGVLRAMWDVCLDYEGEEGRSQLKWIISDHEHEARDDDCIRFIVRDLGGGLVRSAETWLDAGKRELLMDIALPGSGGPVPAASTSHVSLCCALILAGIDRGDTEMVLLALQGARIDDERRMAKWLFQNDAVRRAVRKGNAEVLTHMVTQLGYPVENWDERVIDAIRGSHLAVAEFLFTQCPDHKITPNMRSAAIETPDQRFADLVFFSGRRMQFW